MTDLTELEVAIYGELGDWLDKYDRHLLGTKAHQVLSLRLAHVVELLKQGEES